MIVSQAQTEIPSLESTITTAKKRRLRRKKLHAALVDQSSKIVNIHESKEICENTKTVEPPKEISSINFEVLSSNFKGPVMSSKEPSQSRDDVLAARAAKKLAKQSKGKGDVIETKETPPKDIVHQENQQKDSPLKVAHKKENTVKVVETSPKQLHGLPSQKGKEVVVCKDEVDKAVLNSELTNDVASNISKEQIKADRAAKKAVKQAKKKAPAEEGRDDKNITVKEVVQTLNDIVNVAKEVQEVTAKVQAIDLETKKPEDSGKSKAELRAERRAKQEAQRAAKQATTQQKTVKPSEPSVEAQSADKPQLKVKADVVKEKPVKPKSVVKSKQSSNRVNWFQHLTSPYHDKEALKKIPLNSHLHPAIIKLGVQLASRVVYGSNARCVALLDALKKMVSDYTLPAKTEFARGLEAHLASSLEFLWSMRQPSASQTNAVKFFRHQLTQLANNVDEFDAKKKLHEEIDRYIHEQINMAGEAISITVRKKITDGDTILVYGCSSLIERILREAHEAGKQFHSIVVGHRLLPAREMLRRLTASGLPCTYVDITALHFVMTRVKLVVLSASALLVNGCVVGAAGTASVALAAKQYNVPALVACETHKFCDRVQTDAFVHNELGDPDELIDKTDENSPLKDWRSNPNLTPLNLTYDVTPPSLVTAVVTELAILPCTSAPVVLRFKLSEYGV